jgi:transposase-like protein
MAPMGRCVGIAFGSCCPYIGAIMNRTPGKTTAERERYWTKIIKQARVHCDGVLAYCTVKNISINNYYHWFKRLRAKHPEWNDLATHRAELTGNGSDRQTEPETEVIERAVRRKFTAAYKSKILRDTEAATPGTMAAILRKEGLYSSHLQKWRTEESRRAQEARKRGPKTNPLTPEVKKLRAENARLEKRLTKAGHIIELQKKIAEIMEVTLEEIPDDE